MLQVAHWETHSGRPLTTRPLLPILRRRQCHRATRQRIFLPTPEAAISREATEPSPAELFEKFFGPTLFTPWSRLLLEHAEPEAGERVLDLACATGIVARQVAPVVGDDGAVVGVDINPQMLEVARERAAAENVSVDWYEGDATALDFSDGTFDLALCQQGLQFLPDPVKALREVERVLVDDGRVALNVWQPLERQPVYSALLEAEARYLGADVEKVAAPFQFGDAQRVRSVMEEAGFQRVRVEERSLIVEFPDPDAFVTLTIMAGAAVVPELAPEDAEDRAALIEAVGRECADVLRRHREDGRLRFPTPNYLATGYAQG